MSTFITKLDAEGPGPRLAVKDIVDVAGVPTTCGSRAIARTASVAARDAACMTGARVAGARIVGKANLHELAMLPIGTNPWFGTPVNPLDPDLIPGGSSSGSAVAVATDEADVAIGSDTGGSVRVPAACCGIAGLKTTHGRIPVEGVWPLAPSLDTIGPMAATTQGVVVGMQLLEPGFVPAPAPARVVGRVRTAAHPDLERAVDDALDAAELEVVTLDWDGIDAGAQLFAAIYFAEMWTVDHALVDANPNDVGADVSQTVAIAAMFRDQADEAYHGLAHWRAQLLELFDRVEVLALPTLPIFPPRLADITPDTLVPIAVETTKYVAPFNAAGTPCTAQPVPCRGSRIPASLQLVGPMGGEELLLTTAQAIEQAT